MDGTRRSLGMSAFTPPLCRSVIRMRVKQTSPYPESFDRNYYGVVKREYAHLKHVHIFAKEDYEIDDLDTPWLEDNRGRDLEVIRKKLAEGEREEDELELPERAFRHEDLHDISWEEFEQRCKECDGVDGRVWMNEFGEVDEEWIGLRKVVLGDNMEHIPDGKGGVRYENEEEERRKLEKSMDEIQWMEAEKAMEQVTWRFGEELGEVESIDKWKQEAVKRGGNATYGESDDLLPIKRKEEWEKVDVEDQEAGLRQHEGKWKGSIEWEDGTANVYSEVEGLEWTTVIEGDSTVVSRAKTEEGEGLRRGRGVWECGSFVTEGEGTLGKSFWKWMKGQAVVEMCAKRGDQRVRVGVYEREGLHVVVLKESRSGEWKDGQVEGRWEGSGIMYHPEYWPLGAVRTKTVWEWKKGSVKEDEVSWEGEGKRRRRVSKRVRAAREWDKKRLCECSMICEEQLGGKKYKHGWIVNGTRLKSPRIGSFVSDYEGRIFAGGLVTWPSKKGGEEVYCSKLMGTRIVAIRNELGTLVGCLKVSETQTEDEDMVCNYV